jgi:gamma-glutamyl phosphate reductase
VRRGVSVATLIRQGVDIVISQGGESSVDELYRRAALPVGKFRSGRHDVSIHHDTYLAEEFPG